jgi:hypothetical protein
MNMQNLLQQKQKEMNQMNHINRSSDNRCGENNPSTTHFPFSVFRCPSTKPRLFVLIAFICAGFLSLSQAQTGNNHMPDLKLLQGTWRFETATYLVYNHEDLSLPVDSISVDRAEMLDNAPEFPFGIVFQKMTVLDKRIICSFGKRKQNADYFLNGNTLKMMQNHAVIHRTGPQTGQPTNQQTNQQQHDFYTHNTQETLSLPDYSCKIEENRLIFNFHYSYGSSQYHFPVKGVLTIVYLIEK